MLDFPSQVCTCPGCGQIKTAADEPINPDIETGLDEEIERIFAKEVIKEINSELKDNQACLSMNGRTVTIYVYRSAKLTKTAEKVFEELGYNWEFLASEGNYSFRGDLLPNVFEGLKKSGAITSYSKSYYGLNYLVWC
jgi:hypothetical protein